MTPPGERLRRRRQDLQLPVREVEERSEDIALRKGNSAFVVSKSAVSRIENEHILPNAFHLYSLCEIYSIDYEEVLRWWDIDLTLLTERSRSGQVDRTTPVNLSKEVDPAESIEVPGRERGSLVTASTQLLSDLVAEWREIPLSVLRHFDRRQYRYARIGSEDQTMSPLILPGSVVQIDPRQTRLTQGGSTQFWGKPLYFFDLRGIYRCCWFDRRSNDQIVLLPHPDSSTGQEVLRYPRDVSVVGRVTAVFLPLEPGFSESV